MAAKTNDTESEQKSDSQAEKARAEASDTAGLVFMTNSDASLHVHPSCVNAHVAAGWKVVV